MDPGPRRYRFTITVDVEHEHPAYDDPEWVADAAWGTLTNEYSLRAMYESIEELAVEDPIGSITGRVPTLARRSRRRSLRSGRAAGPHPRPPLRRVDLIT
jgi:hypothetical protein